MKGLAAPVSAYKGNEPYVFVSYEPSDFDKVFEYIKKIVEAGFRIWYQEGISPGADWAEEVALAINNATGFLAFISPAAAASRDLKNEIVFALSKNIPMVCVYIGDTKLPLGLEMQLANVTAIPIYRFDHNDKFYERLLKALPENTKVTSVAQTVQEPREETL